MRIITVSREFGSGGRELGKRLADLLGVPCYDKEVIREVAKLQGITPEHVEHITQSDIRKIYPMTIGRSIFSQVQYNEKAIQVVGAEKEVLKRLASQGDCVVIGRSADVILQEMKPFNVFVFADKEAKLARCMAHIRPGETQKEILKQMRRIDKDRASNHQLLSDHPWGRKEGYHLCVNTTGADIKALAGAIAQYASTWFAGRE